MTALHPLLRSKSKERNRIFFMVFALLLIAGGFTLLFLDSTGVGYYRYVDEVVKDPAIWQNKQLQVHGFVVPGSLQSGPDSHRQTMRYDFAIENCGKQITVKHFGVVPDTFQEQAEVVVQGKLAINSQNILLEAQEISTKCPSKYSPDPEQEKARARRCLHD